ncbi:hypothetical protein [Pseudomonas atacamensis]|uniref:hypothetical protein n=1 Tax=Pseudomonas atacamensis TaxID=2565368 RepID=UPI0038207A6A
MTELLDKAARIAIERIQHLTDVYEGQPEVSLHQHVRAKRRARAITAKAFKLIYLDTNVWKCVADFQWGKTSLTDEMMHLGATVERAMASGRFAFPIGAPTLLELDAMTDGTTRDSLNQVVDQMSRGFCILPYTERLDTELRQIRSNQFPEQEGLENFLCSPIELFGIPEVSSVGFWPDVDKLAFDKAMFDALAEMPFSVLLDIGRDELGNKWDNSLSILELNIGKAEHQAVVENLNTGIAIELRSLMSRWFAGQGIQMSLEDVNRYVLRAMQHWYANQDTKALATLRTLGSTYGLMRFDQQRKYHNGDPNDFMVAASALPAASALFTDRKLANLLADKRIKVASYSNCEVVSGFGEMARYLERHI